MPNLTVTNIGSMPVFLSDLYILLYPGDSITAYRPQSALSAMTGLIAAKNAHQVSVVLANTPDEDAIEIEHLIAPGQLTLDPTKPISILTNATGGQANFVLPNGADGLIKEVFCHYDTTNFILLQITTGPLGNDAIDLPAPGAYVKLVWNTALGGWLAILMSGSAIYD